MRHDRPYSPALTESPMVASKMIKSTAMVKPRDECQDEGVDAERVSVRAIQTTHRRRNVNKSALRNPFPIPCRSLSI